MSLAILFHFLCTQHVSDINISIIRSLRHIGRFVLGSLCVGDLVRLDLSSVRVVGFNLQHGHMLRSWIVEKHMHFDYFKSLRFVLLVTKVSLKITVKETSGCTFICSLDVFKGFNFLTILPIFTKFLRNIISLQETPNPELQFPIIGNIGMAKAQIIWSWRNSCTIVPHSRNPKLTSGKEYG